MVAGEMLHRVRNVFAVANAIVRISAKSASTVDDMVDNLSGRLLALANAQTLALSTATQEGTYIGYDLKRLAQSLIKPYEASPNGSCTRFRISGRSVLKPVSLERDQYHHASPTAALIAAIERQIGVSLSAKK